MMEATVLRVSQSSSYLPNNLGACLSAQWLYPVELWPPDDNLVHPHPVNKVSAEWLRQLRWGRPYPNSWIGPLSALFMSREKSVTLEVETGTLHVHTEHLGYSAHHWLGAGREGISPEALEGTGPSDMLTLDMQYPERHGRIFLLV